MSLTFSFALSQQQTFELRCDYGTRSLQQTELITLLTLCEEKYYAQESNRPSELQQIGKQLYQWLDGKEGWLRKLQTDNYTIDLNLIQTSDVQTLNPDTERVALGLTHFPWELLHNGTSFLLPLPFKGRELKKSQKTCKIGVGRRQ